jgi:hypothetical protein
VLIILICIYLFNECAVLCCLFTFYHQLLLTLTSNNNDIGLCLAMKYKISYQLCERKSFILISVYLIGKFLLTTHHNSSCQVKNHKNFSSLHFVKENFSLFLRFFWLKSLNMHASLYTENIGSCSCDDITYLLLLLHN